MRHRPGAGPDASGSGGIARSIRRLYVASQLRDVLPHSAKVAGRRAWLHLARAVGYPISSPRLPRPALAQRRPTMRLSHVLLACDLNPAYLDFWPSAQHAWREIIDLEPVLVLIAAPDEVPPLLQDDRAVIVLPPLPGVHSALQAQCIRLLYPALLDVDDAVLIADIDLYPLDPRYFHRPIAKLDARHFISYRDARINKREIDINYNAAAPSTWASIFDVRTLDDVRSRLHEWTAGKEYDGRRGWPGWYTDQQLLYETLIREAAPHGRLWMLDDDYCRFNRLGRTELDGGLDPHQRKGILGRRYSDCGGLVPFGEHRAVNELVVELGLEVAQRGRPQPRGALARV